MSLSKSDINKIAELLNKQEDRLSIKINNIHKDLKEVKKDVNYIRDDYAHLSTFVQNELESASDHFDRNDQRLDMLEKRLNIN